MRTTALATAWIFLTGLASAATFDCEPAKQPRWDLTTANFRLRLPDGDSAPKRYRGVLLVVPEQDHDGRELVNEHRWQELADRWQFALLGVHLEGGNDYSIAPNGSGPALLAALKDLARCPRCRMAVPSARSPLRRARWSMFSVNRRGR